MKRVLAVACLMLSASNAFALYPGNFCSEDGKIVLSLGPAQTIYENEENHDQGASWSVNSVNVTINGGLAYSKWLSVSEAGDTADGGYDVTLIDRKAIFLPDSITIAATRADYEKSVPATAKITKTNISKLTPYINKDLTFCANPY